MLLELDVVMKPRSSGQTHNIAIMRAYNLPRTQHVLCDR